MGYGEQWGCFWGDVEKTVQRLPKILEQGRSVSGDGELMTNPRRSLSNGEYVVYAYGDTPACCLAICAAAEDLKSLELASAYPWLRDGIPLVLEVLDSHHLEDEYEGVVEGVTRETETISFFDPLFCLNHSLYRRGQKFEFSMAALAYVIEKVENTNIRITEGAALEIERKRALEENPDADVNQIKSVDISMAELRCLLPREDGMNAEFQTVVEEARYFHSEDSEICQMRVILKRSGDEQLAAMLYASEHVLKDYRPQVGDSIRGVLWLQGYPLKPVESTESWIDQVSPESSSREMEGIGRYFGVFEALKDRHYGVRALGSSIAMCGWDVTPYDNPTGSPDIPELFLQRGEQQLNLWIRSYICGQEPELGFTPQEQQQYEEVSRGHGQDAVCVTVICSDVGKGYTFKCQGLESLEHHIGKINLTEFIRKAELDGAGDGPA
jgi:hypothetical protein